MPQIGHPYHILSLSLMEDGEIEQRSGKLMSSVRDRILQSYELIAALVTCTRSKQDYIYQHSSMKCEGVHEPPIHLRIYGQMVVSLGRQVSFI